METIVFLMIFLWRAGGLMLVGMAFYKWGSLFVSFGFISLIMILVKSDGNGWIKNHLAAVGQMALTNYIMQSIICVFIFYGLGFGLFGYVERIWQTVIVLGIWIIQLMWSSQWLNQF